ARVLTDLGQAPPKAPLTLTLKFGYHFLFMAKAKGADLTGTMNPVPVTLTIGNDTGSTAVTAKIE
ncbi:MAG: hypothetical protein ACRERV_17420, partial [Methylococcales bacterium]